MKIIAGLSSAILFVLMIACADADNLSKVRRSSPQGSVSQICSNAEIKDTTAACADADNLSKVSQSSQQGSVSQICSNAAIKDITALLGKGVTLMTSGPESLYQVCRVADGVFTLKLRGGFFCEPGAEKCEPDRFEVRFPEAIEDIFGIGRQTTAGQSILHLTDKGVKDAKEQGVEEYLDTSFSTGHMTHPDGSSQFIGDPARMKTPVIVMPAKSILLAYIQPAVKMLRVTRKKPPQTSVGTEIVMKKHLSYSEGNPGKFVVIKGANPDEMYRKY